MNIRPTNSRRWRGVKPVRDTVVVAVCCPYCGERFDAVVDRSVERQEYAEDCFVCCRPIVFSVAVDVAADGDVSIETRAEND